MEEFRGNRRSGGAPETFLGPSPLEQGLFYSLKLIWRRKN